MWRPATVVTPPSGEVVSTTDVKRRLRIDFTDDDADITLMTAAAVDHVEKRCNIVLSERTVEARCDDFSDFARLPFAPVSDIVSITYIDMNGDEQTLSGDVYELRSAGLEAEVALKYGQVWPSRRHGSLITVEADIGYATPPDAVRHAVLILVADFYEKREAGVEPSWSVVDTLLCNYWRGL